VRRPRFLRGGPKPVKWYRRGELCLVGLSVQHFSVDRARGLKRVVKPDAAAVGLPGPGAGIGPQGGPWWRCRHCNRERRG